MNLSPPRLNPITIIGGGLAGLTLGIALRRRGARVTVHEAGAYPRHRVCGEFISGRGQDCLQELGLMSAVLRAGARPAHNTVFFGANRRGPSRQLPRPALCISRYHLDQLLASEFSSLGGELRTGSRVNPAPGEGLVRATGRRPTVAEDGWRWFGVKAHAVGLELEADLEMHLLPQGYVGLCRLADRRVNLCGLFRRRPGESDTPRQPVDWLRGPANSPLAQRLAGVEFDPDSVCTIAGLNLSPRPWGNEPEAVVVGDSLTMIPPITGNGMSMAFESAALAAEPLLHYASGATSWAEAAATIAFMERRRFRRRLFWARWLQIGALGLSTCPRLFSAFMELRPAWTLGFAATR